jgi:hypothetical protein
LTKPEDSWRQELGYSGRKPGTPAWNASRYVVFRHLARRINADAAAQLDSDMGKLAGLLGQPGGSPLEIVATANRAAGVVGQVARQLNARGYDQSFTISLMRAIAQDSESISAQGQRAAEQAVMSLDSLFVAYTQNTKAENESELREAINVLFQQLDNPSAYDAPRFARQLQKVSLVLSRPGAQRASQ